MPFPEERQILVTNRPDLLTRDFNSALKRLEAKIEYRIEEKGTHSMSSVHEILGLIEEEVLEFKVAIQQNLKPEQKEEELLDIAVAAIFGIASITSKGIDW